MSRRTPAALALALACAACSGDSGESAPGSVPAAGPGSSPAVVEARGRPPVQPIRRSYFPRRSDVDFWETIPRAEAEPEFLLQVHPRVETPAEGPWIATFLDARGEVLTRIRNVRVDVATGYFLFLCSARSFPPGDWTLELEVEEGGFVGREREKVFRFRVE